MFKFLKDDENCKENEDVLENNEFKTSRELNVAIEILPTSVHTQIAFEVPHLELQDNILQGKNKINFISVAELLQSSFTKNDNNIRKILDTSSDLISGVYEGGFKIWESTFDLINYLKKNSDAFSIGTNTRVLDLGCGSGLLGIYALSRATPSVHFQDYNPEVLNFLTIPNVILNFGEKCLSRSKFFSGDWASFDSFTTNLNLQSSSKYDYILSSETIYNINNLQKIYQLVFNHLSPSGTLFLAAKTCYFGVGGGTVAFKSLIEVDGRMEYEVLDVIREGVQREVLCVKFK